MPGDYRQYLEVQCKSWIDFTVKFTRPKRRSSWEALEEQFQGNWQLLGTCPGEFWTLLSVASVGDYIILYHLISPIVGWCETSGHLPTPFGQVWLSKPIPIPIKTILILCPQRNRSTTKNHEFLSDFVYWGNGMTINVLSLAINGDTLLRASQRLSGLQGSKK